MLAKPYILVMARKIKSLIIHCTDSDDSLDVGFREINSWHKDRGWLSPSGVHCGYHYIVRRDGLVERGRPDEEIGSHVKGHNSNSIGIVWVGRKAISDSQIRSLKALIRGLCNKHDLDVTDDVFGHYEFDDNKTCPNLDMVKLRAELIFKG